MSSSRKRRAIDHELRQPHQRVGDGVEIGGRPVAIALEQLEDARLLHQVARKLDIERRKRHGRVIEDLRRRAAGAEQDHRAEQPVLGHAEQKLMRFRPARSWAAR